MGGSVESGLVRQREPGAKTPKVTTEETQKKERERNTRETEKTNRIKRPRKKKSR